MLGCKGLTWWHSPWRFCILPPVFFRFHFILWIKNTRKSTEQSHNQKGKKNTQWFHLSNHDTWEGWTLHLLLHVNVLSKWEKKPMKKKTAVQIKGWKKRERSIRCVNSSQEVVLPTLSSHVLFLFSNDQHSFFDIPKMLPHQYITCWLITDLYKKMTQLESNRIML